jgi:pSer/pThr/pTyr-binding forkhead associated (FHA) protein
MAASMWLIQNADSDDARFTFRMAPGAIKTIGRVAGVDFIVDAALVSRVHCRLEAREEALDIVDLQSTNGTFINDTRVERGQAREGDRLRVGRVEFQISRS